jgi:hypothetical protein
MTTQMATRMTTPDDNPDDKGQNKMTIPDNNPAKKLDETPVDDPDVQDNNPDDRF